MSLNFGGPRGPFPGPGQIGTPPAGRFRNIYQQSPPPGASSGRGNKERAVTFMPNDVKIPRQPKPPDKPLPAYMRYSRKVWETVKGLHPDMKMWDIGKVIGEQWRNLPDDERQGFFAEYEVEKSEYQEAMKVYHNSSAYRDWLKAKEKAQQAIQEQQMMEKMIGAQLPKEEPRFQLQQMEEDDVRESRLYDDFSTKHVATSRFQRNHRLIAEIFNESTVPDIKTIVTKPRLENLKRQVQSLMQHQKKLENEIQEMEGKFLAKKEKILKRSDDFEEKVKKLSEPPPSPSVTRKSPEPESTASVSGNNDGSSTKLSGAFTAGTVEETTGEKVDDQETNTKEDLLCKENYSMSVTSPQFPQTSDQNVTSPQIPLPSTNQNVTSPQIPLPSTNQNVTSPQIPLPSTNQNVTSPQIPLPSANQNVTSSQILLPTTNQSVTSPQIPLPSANQNITSPQILLPSTNQNVTSPQIPLPPANQKITSPQIPLPSTNQNVTSPHILLSAVNQNITSPQTEQVSLESSIDPFREEAPATSSMSTPANLSDTPSEKMDTT